MALLFQHLLKGIRALERGAVVLIFLTMVVLFSFSVLIRELPGNYSSNFAWIEEAVGIMNLYLVFLSLGLALEKGRHVSISTVRDNIDPNIKKWLYKIIDLIELCFCLYLSVLSVQLTSFVLKTGQLSPTLGVSMALLYAAPIIGFSLMALRYILSLFGGIDRYIGESVEAEIENEEIGKSQSDSSDNEQVKKLRRVS